MSYYDQKGVLQTFHGTMSDVIYPEVKKWLLEKTGQELLLGPSEAAEEELEEENR